MTIGMSLKLVKSYHFKLCYTVANNYRSTRQLWMAHNIDILNVIGNLFLCGNNLGDCVEDRYENSSVTFIYLSYMSFESNKLTVLPHIVWRSARIGQLYLQKNYLLAVVPSVMKLLNFLDF